MVLHQCRLTLGVASFRFDVIDKDGDKSVSFVEFQRGCDRLGLGLSQSQCTQVSQRPMAACMCSQWSHCQLLVTKTAAICVHGC